MPSTCFFSTAKHHTAFNGLPAAAASVRVPQPTTWFCCCRHCCHGACLQSVAGILCFWSFELLVLLILLKHPRTFTQRTAAAAAATAAMALDVAECCRHPVLLVI
jgi:hypothetical protein